MWCGFGDCDSNRVSGKKKTNNNKDSTEIRKTIKDSNVLESFNKMKLTVHTHEKNNKLAKSNYPTLPY